MMKTSSRASSLARCLPGPIRRFAVGELGDRASVSIEMALIVPIFALALIGTMDYSMALYRNLQVDEAAQAGAKYAISHGWSSKISSAVTSATSLSGMSARPSPSEFCGCPSSAGITSATCTSTCPSGETAGTYVKVGAQATYTTLFPYPAIPSSFTFSATSTVRIQ